MAHADVPRHGLVGRALRRRRTSAGFQRDANGEMFARWMQMGALMPFCRNHSAKYTVDQEPWSFGPEVEAISREYLRLRYRLLPFLYNVFYKSAQTGLPDHAAAAAGVSRRSEHALNLSDQFLLGTDLLVCPVYQPGATNRMVYLPAGYMGRFLDRRALGGRAAHRGGGAAGAHAAVRAGRAPSCRWSRPVNHTGERDGKELIVHVYAGEDGQLGAV